MDALHKAGKTAGGLHGIPISIKETIYLKVLLFELFSPLTRVNPVLSAPLRCARA